MLAKSLGILLVFAQPPPGVALAPYEPARGCYIGAYIELDPVVKNDIAAFERLVGKKHATYFRYVGYGQAFPFGWVQQLKAGGYIPHIAWEPNDGLDKVQDDDYLRGWAEAARHADVPIFLRFASEMNGTWEAWSGNPALYIEKWRLVYRVMHAVAPKVIMVWCPFATPRASIPQYYPGDEYVDWVGVNIYSVLRHNGRPEEIGEEDPRDLLRPIYEAYAARKPIAICEYAATHYCVATKQRATDFAIACMRALYGSLPKQFPRVKMISWLSVDAATHGLAHNDYALTTDQQVLETYREIIASDYFLSAAVEAPAGATVASVPREATHSAALKARLPVPEGVLLAAASLDEVPRDQVAIAILGAPPDAVNGRFTVAVRVPPSISVGTVTIYLDGRVRLITNGPPYSLTLDASALAQGTHIVKVEVSDQYDGKVKTAEAAFVVAPQK